MCEKALKNHEQLVEYLKERNGVVELTLQSLDEKFGTYYFQSSCCGCTILLFSINMGIKIEGCEYGTDDYWDSLKSICYSLIGKTFAVKVPDYEFYNCHNFYMGVLEKELTFEAQKESAISGNMSAEVLNDGYVPLQYSDSNNSVVTSSGRRFQRPNKPLK